MSVLKKGSHWIWTHVLEPSEEGVYNLGAETVSEGKKLLHTGEDAVENISRSAINLSNPITMLAAAVVAGIFLFRQ